VIPFVKEMHNDHIKIDYISSNLRGLVENPPKNDSILREVVGDYLQDAKRKQKLNESDLDTTIT
jgi:hypothetical protein|tara:strand:- start:18 stop:209 length:192 start_codon:yes stop_codon:yes gene_type:complete